ncbi:MAG TPA: septation protein A [Gammaproteobacteria bacterium]|nr:septation protein A [Gammaproteobacteria bacterium]
MAALFELLPIVLFFIVFKLAGIYVATGVLIGTSVIQLAVSRWREHRFRTMPVAVTVLAVVLGGVTIALHDPVFIKWKFSVVYWLFAIVLIGGQFIGKKTLIERGMRAMNSEINLPAPIWKRLNLSWALFFLLLGCINTWVIYNLTTEQWVDFKFYGVLGATLLFVIGQAIYLSRHVEMNTEKES